jgi:hypothetical protein
MKIGDLVKWKDDNSTVSMPPGYHNWEDVGVMEDLEIISGVEDLTNL